MKKLFILILIIAVLSIQPATAITIVSTTTVLSDPIGYIGGDRVQVIAIADPTICPHMQAEIIPNRIQLDRDFITNADLFVAINGSVDKEYVMPYIEKFMKANNNANISWRTLKDPSMNWNTPGGARALSQETTKWLIDTDPQNRTYYEGRLSSYLALIDAADLTTDERSQIAGQDVIVMLWQKEAAGNWLGLNVVAVFAPDFYNNGQSTPRAVINDIFDHPEKYRNVKYVIDNMQSGDMAKGIEEALHDNKIPAKRVIFTNFPGSVQGAGTLPDVLQYNKGLVTPSTDKTPADGPAVFPSPLGTEMALLGIGLVLIGLHYRRK